MSKITLRFALFLIALLPHLVLGTSLPSGCLVDPDAGPYSPNNKTDYVNTISYIDSNNPDPKKPINTCFCQDDGTNTFCVDTFQNYIGGGTDWYINAIGNATAVSILQSHCWRCDTGPLTIAFKNQYFSVSIFPNTLATGIPPATSSASANDFNKFAMACLIVVMFWATLF
ncbi:hypothetical protein HDU76_013269 [Blyttiomyces sp. JEL0837]|nr:hypothetical protein HDU76_013269 [Blyttiomyces sp. JEL0837]